MPFNESSAFMLEALFNDTSQPEEITSDEVRLWYERIISMVMLVLNFMGVATNAINIRVFINQGLSDSSTLSLFSLAISDLGSCLSLLPFSLCQIMEMMNYKAIFTSCSNVQYLLTVFHLILVRITCWTTVYISIERCLSIIMPLKFKNIFTPRVTKLVMILIYLLIFSIHVFPPGHKIQWTFNSKFNQTLLYFSGTRSAINRMRILSVIFDTSTPSLVICIVAASTALMVRKLMMSSKFRQSSSNTGQKEVTEKIDSKQNDPRQKRDAAILKAIAIVMGIFLICQMMSYIPGLALSLIPGMSLRGTNRNLVHVLYTYKFLIDSLNASTNIFVYITVSSRYKAAFARVFLNKKKRKH